MLRHWKAAASCFFLLSSLIGAGAQSSPAPSAHPLTIFITASTADNSPLDPAALRVTLDGKPAQVLSLHTAKNDKLLFVLLVDVSTSQAPYADAVRHAATRIFQQISSQGGVGYLGTFTGSLRLSNGPILASGVVPKALDSTQFFGPSSIYDAVAASSRLLRRQAQPDFPRRAIILITDGDDDASDRTLEKLLDAVEPEGTPIFSLATPHSNGYGGYGRRALKLMSSLTGGVAIAPRNLDAGVAPLLSALDQQWQLTIAAPADQSGKPGTLSVKTRQKHVHISAPAQVEIP